MARTQAADYEERREAIIEKAAKLFARTGFLGASVADLAKACKTSKSLIYHYFSSKEEILDAVMTSHIDQLLNDVEEVMARPEEPREQLKSLLLAFMRHYVDAADRQKVVLNELGNLPRKSRAEIVRKQRIVVDAVQQQVVALNPDLEKDSARARVHTMLIFGMINWTMNWFDPAGPITADEIADMAYRHAIASS